MLSALPAEAQTSNGTLTGVVRDRSGAVIANADIIVTNEQTTEIRQTKSNAQGEYRVDAIGAGSYSLRAEAPGFQVIDIKGLKVNGSVITSYDAILAVGATATTVEVQANTNAINRDNGQLSSTLGGPARFSMPPSSANPIQIPYPKANKGIKLITGSSE